MKRILIGMMVATMLLAAACGGSGGGGGGGGLDKAEVTKVYQLNQQGGMLKTSLERLVQVLAAAGECKPGQQVAFDTGEVACSDGGTARINGQVDCTLATNAGASTITINSISGTLTATGCIDKAVLAAGGATFNVTQTGTSTQFAFGNGTAITVETTNPPVITINGTATVAFSNETLIYSEQGATGLTTATMNYTQRFIFNNVTVSGGTGPSCQADTVTVTEGSSNGTCSVSSDCETCT